MINILTTNAQYILGVFLIPSTLLLILTVFVLREFHQRWEWLKTMHPRVMYVEIFILVVGLSYVYTGFYALHPDLGSDGYPLTLVFLISCITLGLTMWLCEIRQRRRQSL